MIIKVGSIFDSKSEALVNPVNCVGVMGKGLALEFKKRFPEVFPEYKEVCSDKWLVPGKILCTKPNFDSRIIIHFPTKVHWKDGSNVINIQMGLEELRHFLKWAEIHSVALPLLGCGLGGLDKKEVIPLIEKFAKSIPDIDVELWVEKESDATP